MYIPIIGLAVGILAGIIFGGSLSLAASKYLAVIIIVALDVILAGYKSMLEDKLDRTYLLLSFAAAAFISCVLVFFSSRTGIDIYLVAAVALGIRIYSNINETIALLLARRREKKFITGSRFPEE